jgi:hypothetical protein
MSFRAYAYGYSKHSQNDDDVTLSIPTRSVPNSFNHRFHI